MRGLYHMIVDEVPDMAVALNPGFAHYAVQWWPTLSRLRSQGTPLIATGYGAYLETFYEYDRRIVPIFDGSSLQLPTGQFRSTVSDVPYWYAPGGVYWTNKQAVHEVDSYVDAKSRVIKVHNFPAEPESPALPLPAACGVGNGSQGSSQMAEVETVCSDLNGTAFLAGRVGFGVRFATKSPFKYCDDPIHGLCHPGDVVTLLEPRASAPPVEDLPPPWLLRDTLQKGMLCTPGSELFRPCLEAHIQAVPAFSVAEHDPYTQLDTFFNRVVPECARQAVADEWGWK